MEEVILEWLFDRLFPGVLVGYIWDLAKERSVIMRLIRLFAIFFLGDTIVNDTEFIVDCEFIELGRAKLGQIILELALGWLLRPIFETSDK